MLKRGCKSQIQNSRLVPKVLKSNTRKRLRRSTSNPELAGRRAPLHDLAVHLININPLTHHPIARLAEAAVSLPDEELLHLLDQWTLLNAPRQTQIRRRPPRSYGNDKVPNNGRDSTYKKTQDLFAKNKKALANPILEGRPIDTYEPTYSPSQDIENLYKAIYETDSGPDAAPITRPKLTNNTISWARTWNALKQDGVFRRLAKKKSPWPTSKDGDPAIPTNWGPITIGSALQRLFHRILADRIKNATQLNTSQRGFIQSDGVLTNCLLLDTYMKIKKKQLKPHTMISIDIQKAFDRVSHHAIERALKRSGIDETISNYILRDLNNSQTQILVGRLTTEPIRIRRGVKQGDPLSPILFNLVLDELMDIIQKGKS